MQAKRLGGAVVPQVLHLLAAKQGAGPGRCAPDGPPLDSTPYVSALSACAALPPDVAAADAFVVLGLAARALLLEAFR